jgi:hypothetical protein
LDYIDPSDSEQEKQYIIGIKIKCFSKMTFDVFYKFKTITIMKKITFLLILLLFFPFVFAKLCDKSQILIPIVTLKDDFEKGLPLIENKNVLLGTWEREDVAEELIITSVLKTGLLKVDYLKPKHTVIEKAGWTNSSNVLRIFILFGQDEKSGYSLTLNYISDKNLLVGVYVDGTTNEKTKVVFKKSR